MINWIYRSLSKELENPFIWFPILLSIGIIAVFQMKLTISVMPFLALILGVIICLYKYSKIIFTLILIPVLGVIVTVARIEVVSSSVIKERIGPERVIGRIVDIEEFSNNQARLTLDNLILPKIDRDSTPSRIRIRVRNNPDLLVGERVELFAVVMPPPESYYFDGYNFSRYLWFKGIGGSGFSLTTPKKLEGGEDNSIWETLKEGIDNYRLKISRQIRDVLGDDIGSLAGALITGHTKTIPKNTQDAFRGAGLTHLLVISGFNISLLTLFVIFFVRFSFSFFPSYANRFDSTKIASVFGISAALFYCFISGASIPTVRAVLVVSLVFLAMFFRRNPFTMNTAAAAGFLILIYSPESIFNVSFQLSFAAVIALIGSYEFLKSHKTINKFVSKMRRNPSWLILMLNYMGGVLLATAVATLATNVITIYHFHKIVSFSIFANMIAVPIAAFWITPLTLLFLFLMPFPYLSDWILLLLVPAFQFMKTIAVFFSSLPNAVVPITGANSLYFTFSILGGIIFFLCRSQIRYFGILLVLTGFILIPLHKLPSIHIDKDGRMIAFKKGNKLFFRTPNKRKGVFLRKKWMELHGTIEAVFIEQDTFTFDPRRKVRIYWGSEQDVCAHSSQDLMIAPKLICAESNSSFLITKSELKEFGNISVFWNEEKPVLKGTKKEFPWE